MTVSQPGSRASRPTRAASPVPRWRSWTATATPAGSASRTASPPCPTTTTVLVAPAAARASSTHATIGRPAIGWTTFGRADLIRVPWPAARTTAPMFMGS